MAKYICPILFVVLLSARAASPPLTEQATQYPFTGTWKLNVEKSTFAPGPAPRSTTVTIGIDGSVSFQGIDGDGKPTRRSHPSSVGREVLFDGTKNVTVKTTVVGNVLDDTIKLDGKPIQSVHAVFSQDGQIATVNREGKDPEGHSLHNYEVYEKQ